MIKIVPDLDFLRVKVDWICIISFEIYFVYFDSEFSKILFDFKYLPNRYV